MADENVKCHSHLEKFWQLFIKLTMHFSYHLAIILLGICPREIKIHVPQTEVLMADLFIVWVSFCCCNKWSGSFERQVFILSEVQKPEGLFDITRPQSGCQLRHSSPRASGRGNLLFAFSSSNYAVWFLSWHPGHLTSASLGVMLS